MPKKSRELQSWLEAFPVDEVRAELDELEDRVGELEGEIRYRRRLLEVRDQALGIDAEGGVAKPIASNLIITDAMRHQVTQAARNAFAHGRSIALSPPPGSSADEPDESPEPDSAGEAEILSRADKLLRFLDAHRGETWKLSDIRDRLIADGMLADNEADVHGLQVTASRLARRGRLERPAPGLYRLPVAARDEGA